MKRALTALAFSGLVAFGLAAAAPSAEASAFKIAAPAVGTSAITGENNGSGLFQVSDRRHHWEKRRHWRRHHRHRHRHHDWYWRDRPRSGFYFEFGTDGFRYGPPPYYARPPYYGRPRYVAPRPAYRLPAAHVNWCHARYRSYRAWDNSFQPYHGPRRACISPYWR